MKEIGMFLCGSVFANTIRVSAEIQRALQEGSWQHVVVGVCRIALTIDSAYSLKEKRHVVKSIIERLKARYNASVAEVDMNDKWQRALIGVACVSNEAAHADSMMASIVNFVENDGRAVMVDYSTETLYVD